MTVITKKSDVISVLDNLESMSYAERVYFVTPENFDVNDGINPHMLDENGNPNVVDKKAARLQWIEVTDAFRNLDLKQIVEIPSAPGFPDMVFCANQALPYLTKSREKRAVMSNMFDNRRQDEVIHVENALKAQGYAIDHLPERGLGIHIHRRLYPLPIQ